MPVRQFLIAIIGTCLVFVSVVQPAAADLKTRIVILPFYVEQSRDADTGTSDDGLHYRRMSGFIENHLVDNDFSVIDPFARDGSEKERSRLMERAREDSALACMDMAARYAVDIVYIVWLEVKAKKTQDGYWKASAVVTGKGYDSAGRSLGAGILETVKVTRRDFSQAAALVEKEAGDLVGLRLTRWRRSPEADHFRSALGDDPNRLQSAALINEKYINIRLDQANANEILEIFGKIVNTARGVAVAKQVYHKIVPDNPQACSTEWEVEIDTEATDSFRLQANIMKMIDDVLASDGTLHLMGVPYRYTHDQVRQLAWIFPGSATSRSIQFIADRQQMRNHNALH